LKRWQDIRLAQFIADKFTCRMCGRIEGDTSKLACDHVEPHRGDPDRFWNGPKQTLCLDPCHNKWKQKQEQATLHQRGVWD
jgi:5-methylcytosine-specific restriction protein A